MDSSPSLEIVLPDGHPESLRDELEHLSGGLLAAVSMRLGESGYATPRATVVFSDDIWRDVLQWSEVLGMRADPRSGPERLGGTVGGKTLFNDDGSRFVIVVTADLLLETPFAAWSRTATLAHEFMHVAYGSARRAALGVLPDGSAPWEVARLIALQASEEFRVERLAHAITDHLVTAEQDGEILNYGKWRLAEMLSTVASIASHVEERSLDAVFRYRLSGGDEALGSMWAEVAQLSAEATISLTYVQACVPSGTMLWNLVERTPGVALLEAACSPLFRYLDEHPLMPESVDEWRLDAEGLAIAGRGGWTEAWRCLGLTAVPLESGFFLHVGDPDLPEG